jgi:protein TonB
MGVLCHSLRTIDNNACGCDVVIEATVDADGRVTDVRVPQSALALLDDAALAAVRQYTYEPGRRNGVPEAFPIQVTVSFRLQWLMH